MPTDLLPVPHHRQSHVGACLQACARMVLGYLGRDASEAWLSRLLHSRPFGTPARNIRRLGTQGLSVVYGPTNLTHLRELVQSDVPPIVFVQAGQPPYWTEDSYHAIVVGITEDTVYLNDPAFDRAPQSAPLDDFMLAWSDFDYLHAVITL